MPDKSNLHQTERTFILLRDWVYTTITFKRELVLKKKPPPPPRMIQQHEAWSCLSISCMTVCHDLGYYYLDWWALPRCWNCPNLCTVNSNWRGEWHPCCSLCVSVSSGSLVRWLYVSLSKGILCKKKTNSGILLILLFLSGVRYDIRTGLCCFYSSVSL